MISEEAAEATHKRVRQYLPAAPQPQGLADPHHVGPPGLPVGGERPAAQQPGFVAPPKLLLEPTRAAVQSYILALLAEPRPCAAVVAEDADDGADSSDSSDDDNDDCSGSE